MFLSGEIRWFMRVATSSSALEWFMDEEMHGCRAGGGPPARHDVYLVGDDRGELGIKVRGAKGHSTDPTRTVPGSVSLEIKGLVAVDHGIVASGPFAGPVEIWCKWAFPRMDVGQTRRCVVSKTRWLRKFDTTGPYPVEIPLDKDEQPLDEPVRKCLPALGCNAEMTEIRLSNDERWLTFAFEAFGDRGTIADDLRAVVSELSRRGADRHIKEAERLSYPRWISLHVIPSGTAEDRGQT